MGGRPRCVFGHAQPLRFVVDQPDPSADGAAATVVSLPSLTWRSNHHNARPYTQGRGPRSDPWRRPYHRGLVLPPVVPDRRPPHRPRRAPADLHEGRKCGVDPSRRAATLPVWRIGSRAPLAPAEGHRPEKPPHQGEQNQARHTRIERAPPITGVLNEKATEHQQHQDRAGKKPRPSRQALQADAHALIVPRPAWPPWRSPAVMWPPTTQLGGVGAGPSLIVFIPHPASAGDWATYAADVSARLSTGASSR